MTDSDRTIALAEKALSQIKALRLCGDPQSFEIWYAYVAGTRPKLNAHINDILAQRQTLSPAEIDHIHYQFFSQARVAEQVENVGAKINDEVDQIVGMIEAALGTSAQYQNELEDSTRKLALPIDRDTLRVIVEALVFSTKEVEQENSALLSQKRVYLLGLGRPGRALLRDGELHRRAVALTDHCSRSNISWRS
jgi:diguanylate cyclase